MLPHFLLGELLHVPVERREDVVTTAVRRLFTEDLHELLANAEREPRRVQRGRHGLHDDLLGLCRIGFRRRHVAVVDHGVEHLGASRLRAVDVLARVVVGGRLREAREEGHLTERQLVQVGDTEVGGRRRLQAVGLVPVVDLVEIHLEDLRLAEGARRLDREDRFLDLSRECRIVTEETRFDQLLGDRRATLRDAAARAVDLDRADDAGDVDAGICPEGLVLDGDGRVLHPLRDRVDRDEVTPFVGERVEKVLAAAVVDVRRQRDRHGGEVAG